MEGENQLCRDECEEVIRDLERKAEILRGLHAYKAKHYRWWVNVIVYSTIFSSALISLLSIADPQVLFLNNGSREIFARIITIAGIAIFFLSISDRIFELNRKQTENQEAVRILTDFIRRCHQCRHVELEGNDEKAKTSTVNSIRDTYSMTIRTLPFLDTTDMEFLREKQRLMIKIDLSKKLDKDPYFNLEEGLGKLREIGK